MVQESTQICNNKAWAVSWMSWYLLLGQFLICTIISHREAIHHWRDGISPIQTEHYTFTCTHATKWQENITKSSWIWNIICFFCAVETVLVGMCLYNIDVCLHIIHSCQNTIFFISSAPWHISISSHMKNILGLSYCTWLGITEGFNEVLLAWRGMMGE